MSDANSISERIAQNAILQASGRIAAAATLPLMLMGLGYLVAMGNTVNTHSTDIALLQQSVTAAARRIDAAEQGQSQVLAVLNTLSTDAATTKKDVGYLRDWVEELKRQERETR